MLKLSLTFLFLLSFSALLSAQNELCAEIYEPVCAVKSGKHRTFPNVCEAKSQGFLLQHEGACFAKIQKINACNSKCSSQIVMVCGEKNGKIRTFVNFCFASCANATILNNGSCSAVRALSIATFFSNLVNSAKNSLNATEIWLEEKSANFSGKAKTVWHKIGEQWENCSCEPFNAVVNWVKEVANDTKQLANLTATELKIFERNSIEGFNLFKANLKEEYLKIKNATINALKRFGNRTKEWIAKTVNFIRNVTVEAGEWLIEEGHSLKNKTATWWHKTKQGIENCTCCLIEETEEIFTKIGDLAEKAVDKTKEKIAEIQEKLKKNIISLRNKTEEAVEKTKDYFQALWPCACGREYAPVCVETQEGKQATILNQCFADCPRMKLTTVFNGTCEEIPN